MPRDRGSTKNDGEEEVSVDEMTGTAVAEENAQTGQPVSIDSSSMFKVKELISLSDKITDMPSYFAAGAMAHANRDKEDMIGTEEFKQLVEQYREVGAF